MAGNRLVQVDANDVVGFEFVWDCAVTYAANHCGQAFGLFHKILSADWVVEPFTDGNIGEFDTATGGRCSHRR
jgi:hypothetical protein